MGIQGFVFAGVLLLGGPANRVAERNVIRFQNADVGVVMTIDPAEILHKGVLKDQNRVIQGFTGVSRAIQYRLIGLSGTLPKNLKVKETLQVEAQSHYTEFEVLGERERTVEVGRDGTFSDLIALGTTDDTVFPSDFRQIVRQQLYLVDDKKYPTGRLLAVLSIERRTNDILVKLIWPSADKGTESRIHTEIGDREQFQAEIALCPQFPYSASAGAGAARLFVNSPYNHARARFQSRFTVRTPTFKTWAISSTDRPAKNFISTT